MAPSDRRPKQLRVFEVGPRDGLQNEPQVLSTAQRSGFIERLADAGLTDIECGAFVHPAWVPAMAGTDDLVKALPQRPGVRYWGLVPNPQGLERAVAAGLRFASLVASASESHSRKNLNRSIEEVIRGNREVARLARQEGVALRAYISVAFGCPYEGAVDFMVVRDLARVFFDMGVQDVSLGDTTGMGYPDQLRAAARSIFTVADPQNIAFHFHDTRGMGLVNAMAVIEEGAVRLDASTGGIGGCPYAPGAAGNLATEELVQLLEALGIESGINLERLVEAATWIEQAGIKISSRYYRWARGKIT